MSSSLEEAISKAARFIHVLQNKFKNNQHFVAEPMLGYLSISDS